MIDRGYLIIAKTSDTVDYLACARVLAKSLKLFHPTAHITLVTDGVEADRVFDIVKPFYYPVDELANPHAADWQAYWCSPYHETIKLEADIIITAPIEHWWTHFRQRELVIATRCYDFRGQRAASRKYRQVFDANHLPDTYNGITYWRRTPLAQEFFSLCSYLFAMWHEFSKSLTLGQQDPGTTDLIYACAAEILGREKTTLPNNAVGFVHMKPAINQLAQEDWTRELVWEIGRDFVRINTLAQQYPLHYYIKSFAKEVEPIYDQLLGRSSASTGADSSGADL